MADHSKIEWTDATWNPIVGCSVISPGCKFCYAMRLAGTRMKHHHSRKGLTIDTKAGPVWNGQVRPVEEWLDQPLCWRRPRRIFVCAHGDLFHENVPNEWIDQVFAVMALCPQHTFQVLTKRAERVRNYFARALDRVADAIESMRTDERRVGPLPHLEPGTRWWPLSNVWLGVSVEDQERADERIPHLLQTPAAVRFISAEPLLGPIDLTKLSRPRTGPGTSLPASPPSWNVTDALTGWEGTIDHKGKGASFRCERLDWVIVGGESGGNARPMHPEWARSLRNQCVAANVSFFFKQWGEFHPSLDHLERMNECKAPAPTAIHLTGRAECDWSKAYELLANQKEGWVGMCRVGKKAAGRQLDGREWNEMPEARP